jgi:hypothetical protein
MTATAGRVRGRLTTKQVNSFKQDPRELEIEITANNALIPIVYGRRSVPGMISAFGKDASDNLIVRVYWCAGEIFQVEKIFLNGEVLPAGIEVRNYRGTDYQGVDDLMETITTITGYSDDMVILKPGGRFGVAYSVIKIPPGVITSAPRFQAIIQGRTVYDPREISGNGDPFDSGPNLLTAYNLQFIGDDADTPTAGMDIAGGLFAGGLSVAWFGNAQILGNELELDGTGDYLVLQDTAGADFSTGLWSLEVTCEPDAVTGVKIIYAKGDAGSDRAIHIGHINADIVINLSSDGTTWDIANALTLAATLSANTPIKITIEFTGREYQIYLDGTHVYRIESALPLYATSLPVWLGLASGLAGSLGFDGSISGCRMTKTVIRYGGVHASDAFPYADSDSMSPGYVYNNVTAMVFVELAMNPFYGFRASAPNGLLKCIDWDESLLGGAVPRAQLDIVISESRPTEDWLDLFATYGDFVWYFDEEGITVMPDRPIDATNPSGWEISENGDFIDNADAWTLGADWEHDPDFNVLSKSVASASSCTQVLAKPFEVGATYIATLDIALIGSGALRLDLNGVPLIEEQTAAGKHTYEFTADGSEEGGTLELVADATVLAAVYQASIKRKYWLDQNIDMGSLSLTALSNSDSPTRVSVQYTSPSDDSPNWGEAEPAVAEVVGVESGEIQLIETRLDMRGITRPEEAANKAQSKRNRMQNRVRASWITTDVGVAYQKGSVIDLSDPETEARLLVFLENIGTADAGRYRATGLKYDDSHYPNDLSLPGTAGPVPIGVIALLNDPTVPSGWQLYNPANGKFIKGAGDSFAVGATGGASTLAISGNTDTAGEHVGADSYKFRVRGYYNEDGATSSVIYTETNEPAGGHLHTFDAGTVTPDLYRRENVLVQKITSIGTIIPRNVMVFGQAGLVYPNMTRWLAGVNRLLQAATGNLNTGNNAQVIDAGTTGSTNDTHDHHDSDATALGGPPGVSTLTYYAPVSGGGAHTHEAELVTLDPRLKRKRFALYTGTDDYEVGPGVIFMWAGSFDDIHPDYSLCNGLLGTPDAEDYFIEIAGVGQENTAAGNNTMHLAGYTEYSAPHNHRGGSGSTMSSFDRVAHGENQRHRHGFSGIAVSWQPPYYALALIMYNPNPVTSYEDTALLISGGQANGSTTIVDDGPDTLTATVQGAGSLAYSSAQLLYGLTTLLNSGKRIKYAAFDYGRKFTLEGYFRNSSTGSMILFGNHIAADNNTFEVVKNASGDIDLYIGDTLQATVALGLTSNAWFYVGMCYDYSEWRLYAGLVSVGTAVRDVYADAANSITDDLYWLDRAGGSAAFAGHAGQLRVTRGAAILSGSVIAIPSTAFATE